MSEQPITYAGAGVDVEAGDKAVELMKGAVRATHGPEVLGGVGGFAGLFDASGADSIDVSAMIDSADAAAFDGTGFGLDSAAFESGDIGGQATIDQGFDLGAAGVVIEDPALVNEYIHSGLWDYTDIPEQTDTSVVTVQAYLPKDEGLAEKIAGLRAAFGPSS